VSKKLNRNAQVYQEITTSGKSLLQLYLEVKEELDKLVVALASKSPS